MTTPIQINYKSVNRALIEIASQKEGRLGGKTVIVCKKNGDTRILEGKRLSVIDRIVLMIEKFFGINDEKSLSGQIRNGSIETQKKTNLLVWNKTGVTQALGDIYLHQQHNLIHHNFGSKEEAFLAVLFLAEIKGLPKDNYGSKIIPKIEENNGLYRLNLSESEHLSQAEISEFFIEKYEDASVRLGVMQRLATKINKDFFGGDKVLDGNQFVGTREEILIKKIEELGKNSLSFPGLLVELDKELQRIRASS
ncbi:MAG: hypothetical protein FJZ61_04780 [Chlamydiae bacterium]|nr:hypothetical protein [Chlamydiota bacterium]